MRLARAADVPRAVWFITALWGTLLIGASLVWPATYGYDEPQHADMAYVYSGHPFTLHAPGTLLPTKANTRLQRQLPGYPPHRPLGAVPIAARPHRPSLADLGGRTETTGTQPNQMVQHPPLYYWAEAVVLRLPGVSQLAWDMQLWLMRLLSVLFMLPVPLLCWATARRLLPDAPERDHAALLAAVVPLTIPNLVRDGSAVTNDTLLVLSCSVLLYFLARVVTGDLTRRTAAWTAGALAVALLTKGFALVLPVVVLLAYLLGWRHAPETRRARLSALGIAAVGGVLGGLWWLRNLVEYSAIQPNGFGAGYQIRLFGSPDNHGTVRRFVRPFTTEFLRRLWGGIGLADDPSPGRLVIWGWLVVVAGGLVTAFVVRARRGDRARFAVLLTPVVLTAALVAAGSWHDFSRWSDAVRGAQGRYLYHLVVVVAAIAAIGLTRLVPDRWRRIVAPSVLVLAVATNAFAWYRVLEQWYAAPSRSGIAALLRWSPVPVGATVTLVVVLPIVATIAALIATVRPAAATASLD